MGTNTPANHTKISREKPPLLFRQVQWQSQTNCWKPVGYDSICVVWGAGNLSLTPTSKNLNSKVRRRVSIFIAGPPTNFHALETSQRHHENWPTLNLPECTLTYNIWRERGLQTSHKAAQIIDFSIFKPVAPAGDTVCSQFPIFCFNTTNIPEYSSEQFLPNHISPRSRTSNLHHCTPS